MDSDSKSMSSDFFSIGTDAATLVEPRDSLSNDNEALNPLFVSDTPDDGSAMLLIFEHDDPSNTRLFTNDGQLMFTFVSMTEGRGSKMNMTTSVKDRSQREVGKLCRPSMRGTDMISIGGGEMVKKSKFLSSLSLPMSKTIGKFEHQGFTFKWNCKTDTKGFTMELYTNDQTTQGAIARYMDSRRDWDVPNELVIKQARLELLPPALAHIDIVVFSMMLVERHRWDHSSTTMSHSNTHAWGQMQGGQAVFSGF